MNKYQVSANKSYGQNFLIDEDVVLGICEKANISKNDLIIEIGPGLGTLTARLLEKAGKVIAVELDTKMIHILNDRFSLYDNFKLINDDILKVDLNKLISDELGSLKKVKIVANLPYYITTPIIMKLLEEKLNIDSITVMVQKEVAERLCCSPGTGDTGAITYTINYYTKPEIVLDVPKESFIPSPKVDSNVINLQILNNPSVMVKDEGTLFKVIKFAFMQKRKTLLNSLSNSRMNSKEYFEKMLLDLNIDLKIRPEKLSLDDFAKISDYIYEKNRALSSIFYFF
jgi:16S rRNA (adenine1518-N6/adenine1519-N6)-dimethyltransferase